VGALFTTLGRNRRLLKDFVLRDLKARYVGSSMGFFWSVVFPIINLFVYMFVFRLVLKTRFSDQQGPSEVALIMLAGIVVWSAFAETVSRSTNSLVENSNLIQKVVFPSEVLPLYLTLSSLVNMCIGLPVVLLGVAYFAYVSPSADVETAAVLLQDALPAAAGAAAQAVEPPKYVPLALGLPLVILPVLFALQVAFSVGLGYLLSTLNLFLRDTYHLVGVGVTVWMFATPIFYPDVMVRNAGYGWLLEINPMYWLIESYRDVLCYGSWPEWALLGRFAVVAALVLLVGASFFSAQKPRFPDLL
jgi:ABC-type polysaccharide/polyol phosphate export permease